MSVHDQRYLRRTTLAGPQPVELSPQMKLVPRDEEPREQTYGQSGRIRRTDHRYIPGAKKWYAGYNVKGQEDLLAEDFPVGVRRRRACCIWTLVVLCAIMAVLTTIFAALVIYHFDMDVRGPRGLKLKEGSVGLLKPVAITGQTLLQGTDSVLRAYDNGVLAIGGAFLQLKALSETNSLASWLQLSGSAASIYSPSVTAREGENTDTLVALNADVTEFAARRTQVVGDLVLLNGTEIATTLLASAPNATLEVAADGNLTLAAFSKLEGTASTIRFASGADLTVASNTGGFGLDGVVSAAGDILLPSGVDTPTPPGAAGTAYALCACADGRLYAVPGTDTCTAATNAARCA